MRRSWRIGEGKEEGISMEEEFIRRRIMMMIGRRIGMGIEMIFISKMKIRRRGTRRSRKKGFLRRRRRRKESMRLWKRESMSKREVILKI